MVVQASLRLGPRLAMTLLSIALLSAFEEAVLPVPLDAQENQRCEIKSFTQHKAHDNKYDHVHDGSADEEKIATKLKSARFTPIIWGHALLATALVGSAPVLILFILPLGVSSLEKQQPLLRVFLSFAAGGLLGDALLHLLPHSLPEHLLHARKSTLHNHSHGHKSHEHSVADLYVWLWTLAGILSFFMLEKFVRAQTGESIGHSRGHSHIQAPVQDESASSVSSKSLKARKRPILKEDKNDEEVYEKKVVDLTKVGNSPIAAAGYLNLAADFSHNFTDGLAIGATFLRGTGWTTTVAMLLHELPHEIGDFAILLQSGFTRREAMASQLLTAIGAMIGTIIGLLIEGAGDSSSVWISPFTAGGFIYIACTSVMPQLLEDCSLAQSLKEAGALCVGIGLMALIALNE
ncbi:hypothetical protein CCR75_006527 [Bremia lactucae]|uniref:Zinc transporter n=1 Tax=Bremia lactucae TaxID=4779 RepID=A0A976FPH9_BRELC|nr:hypothetical protein CCR75_006527 [Bremia lactucae]